ncbi:MAG: S41 family peptidase [Spirochaetia bacterium]|jgi:carboxyl-terminal processing protease
MAKIPRRVVFSAAVVLSLAVAFLAGFTVQRSLPQSGTGASGGRLALDFSLIQEVWDVVQKNYVDRPALQEEALTYGAIDGMVNALGDTGHTRFLTPHMVAEERSFLKGSYVGVGLQIEMKNGRATVVAPMDNSPASRAGLRAGQVIVKVDGQSMADFTIDQIAERIMGPIGTTVTLSLFEQDSGTTVDVPLARAEIQVTNVSWQMVPGTTVADIRVSAFSGGVTEKLRAALGEATGRGATAAVLDLRNNPGGQLDEAIGVASQFLKEGDVLIEQDAQGGRHADHVRPGGIALSLPAVVLINNGTASAAEIVAGALQGQKRAPVLGETSFGTGTVLQMFRLTGGSQLLLAVEEWLTPQGQTIWHKGITPDTTVAMGKDLDLLIPSQLKGMSREAFVSNPDLQMVKAVGMLVQAQPRSARITPRPAAATAETAR